jgi:nucleotide-binding universal stress UspA family protein
MKIILAVDSSKYSEWAADFLLKLPLAQEPQISVFHIVAQRNYISPIIESISDKIYKDLMDLMEEKAKKDIAIAEQLTNRIVDKLKIRWNDVKPIIEKGHVADKIIEKAREDHADLVILGSRGLSRIKNLLLGGVSQKIVTHANCAVLVVKRKIRAFKKVLIAIDGSTYSENAVSFLKSHFMPKSFTSVIINVWDYPFTPPKFPVETIAKKYNGAMFRGVFEAQVLCVDGDPAEMIANTARRKKVDLIVIGSKGLTGIKQFFLGSVARKVITYSNNSILVVKNIDKAHFALNLQSQNTEI